MNYLKNIYWVGILAIYSCHNNAVDNFQINGHIENAPSELNIQLINSETGQIIESTSNAEGQFNLQGRLEYPSECEIVYKAGEKKRSHYFWLENTPLSIKGNWDKMEEAEIKGGKEQELQKALFERLSAFFPEQNRLIKEEKYDSLNLLFNKRGLAIQDFALENANSYFGVKYLYMNRLNLDKSKLNNVFKSLDEHIMASSYGQSLLLFSEASELDSGSVYVNFKVNTLQNEEIDLSQTIENKPVLIIFGGLSCMGERERATLKEFQKKHGKDIEVLAFAFAKNQKEWSDEANYDLDVKLLSDLKGNHSPVKIKYGVQATPTVYVIDKDGLIKWKSIVYGEMVNEAALALLEK